MEQYVISLLIELIVVSMLLINKELKMKKKMDMKYVKWIQMILILNKNIVMH